MKCQELSGHVRLITIAEHLYNMVFFSVGFNNEEQQKTFENSGQEEHIIIDGT